MNSRSFGVYMLATYGVSSTDSFLMRTSSPPPASLATESAAVGRAIDIPVVKFSTGSRVSSHLPVIATLPNSTSLPETPSTITVFARLEATGTRTSIDAWRSKNVFSAPNEKRFTFVPSALSCVAE